MPLYQNSKKIIPYVAGKTIASAWINGEKVYSKKSKWTKVALPFPIKEVGKVGNKIAGIRLNVSNNERYYAESSDGGISWSSGISVGNIGHHLCSNYMQNRMIRFNANTLSTTTDGNTGTNIALPSGYTIWNSEYNRPVGTNDARNRSPIVDGFSLIVNESSTGLRKMLSVIHNYTTSFVTEPEYNPPNSPRSLMFLYTIRAGTMYIGSPTDAHTYANGVGSVYTASSNRYTFYRGGPKTSTNEILLASSVPPQAPEGFGNHNSGLCGGNGAEASSASILYTIHNGKVSAIPSVANNPLQGLPLDEYYLKMFYIEFLFIVTTQSGNVYTRRTPYRLSYTSTECAETVGKKQDLNIKDVNCIGVFNATLFIYGDQEVAYCPGNKVFI